LFGKKKRSAFGQPTLKQVIAIRGDNGPLEATFTLQMQSSRTI
jgi:hypothetical protein